MFENAKRRFGVASDALAGAAQGPRPATAARRSAQRRLRLQVGQGGGALVDVRRQFQPAGAGRNGRDRTRV